MNGDYESFQQTLTGLTVGTEYTLSFYAANFGYVSQDGGPVSGVWKVALDSSEVFTSDPLPVQTGWTQVTFAFTATATSQVMEFKAAAETVDWISPNTAYILIDGLSTLTTEDFNSVNNPGTTITSTTYDASTGTLVVTGTDFVANDGATNDVDASLLTFTGEGGATYTLTSADVEIDSATQFTITLNATDKAALEAILNKNGTASDDSTTYNIAAAEDWMPGAPGADTIADLTGNGVTVSGIVEQSIYFIYDDGLPNNTNGNGDCPVGSIEVTGSENYGRTAMNNPGPNDFPGQTLDTSLTYGHVNSTSNLRNTNSYRNGSWTFEDPQPSTKSYGGMICYGPASAVPTPGDTTAPVGTFGLANGATELTTDGSFTLTFDEAVRLLDGSAPTNENIKALITLKDTNGSGADIPFDVTIDGNVITITPVDNLSYGQQVYVAIGATLEDDADNAISPINATFTAEADTTAPVGTFGLANGATELTRDGSFTLTFDEAVRLLDGSAPTNANIEALITLKDTNGSGADIPFDVTINGNVITITPVDNLSYGQQVYVAIGATLEDDADNAISPINATFTVAADTTAPTAQISPSNGSTDVAEDSTIIITFSEAVRLLNDTALTSDNVDALITLKDTDQDGTDIPFEATISGSVITITPSNTFTSGQQVYVAIGATVEDEAENAITATNSTFTVIDYIAPTVVITGPTEPVTDAFPLTFTFSEDVTGFDVNDITIAGGTLSGFSGSGDTYTVIVTPVLGETVTVSVAANAAIDAAGNGNEASGTYTIQAGSPASEFEKYRDEIRQVVVDEAKRSLRSGLSANQRMARGARDRLIAAQREQPECSEDDRELRNEETCDSELVTKTTVPLDVDGNFTLSETGLSTAGNFFQQVGNEEGTYRRLFFGDFDVQHDNDTDSTTATLTGRMAWEQMTSEQTMLGYFIGGELAKSTIGGSFEGDQDRIGLTAGGYVVHELAEQVYLDGFASFGVGRNNLEMANDVLALESEYTTQTVTLGGALTGVYSQKGYDFKPELAFSYGKTWLGDIGFTGRAYGLTDNTLSLDAGDVSIASLTFRPEVIIPIGADFVADTNTQLSFAPRLVCEQIKSTTKTSDCGTGGELGFSSNSEDGMSSADMRVLLDRINGGTRSSFVFSVEHRF